ncbi:hypothetical protein GOARA_064_01700 [Gordonia araii NBRC 100433]|uniref:Uncharacterized protein n=1 Tax=Gordonia araii NBRC 100433 TaxID=1073574 RepID=G7H5P3_9ACTN|nr:hypothetical protein [Gordonia araii]NNG95880.1 hypothetical protein [Gordonia araii NBRC 100433]GAB11168.1 hypothetical protein GOARA_064_01700 [Gordonia araii NBRC 100433]
MAACTPGDVPSIITGYLGFDCEKANPIVTVRNPADLANWTLPVLEVTIVLGAVLALVHAIRRLRRDGDPTNLAIWVGSLVYLFVIEPPLYFPEWFRAEEAMGFMFSHNVFTVNFMFDRLPLYIVAFYPAVSQLAYEIVRAWGFFDGSRRSALRGSIVVALVFQAFYEIFDQLGPQLKWWAWNIDAPFYADTVRQMQDRGIPTDKLGNPSAVPTLASVPWGSVWLFATVSFAVLVYLAVRLVRNAALAGSAPRGWSLTWRIVVAGVVAVISMPLLSIPTAVFGRDEHANQQAQTVVYTIELLLVWAIGLALLYAQWRRLRAQPGTGADDARTAYPFLVVFPPLFLAVHLVLWVTALPAFFGAEDGLTADNTPIGNLPYVVACFAVAVGVLAFALIRGRRAATPFGDGAGAPRGAEVQADAV